jgi:hypothetical protein
MANDIRKLLTDSESKTVSSTGRNGNTATTAKTAASTPGAAIKIEKTAQTAIARER